MSLTANFGCGRVGAMPFLTRLFAAVGGVAIAVGVFVPYAAFDIGDEMEYFQIIDLDEPSYFYTGLDLLIVAVAAAALPFLLRNVVLCGGLLIALGGLSAGSSRMD